LDPDPDSFEMLDPGSMNPDPQHHQGAKKTENQDLDQDHEHALV
jgi:hypothetical protein